MESKKVQIVIPLFNAVEFTKLAVETIRRNTPSDLYNVLFVDNGSTDETKSFLQNLITADPDHFRVVTNAENKGFAGGVNTGLQALSSVDWDYLCVANNDLIFTPNWLPQMLGCLQALPEKFGAIGPVSNAAGGVQGVPANYKSIGEIDQWAREYHQVHQGQLEIADKLVGLCFLMRRAFFDKVGYFDERFIGGMWEDNDYCLRGRLKGFQFVVDRSTFLHHFFSQTFHSNKINTVDYFHANKKRYYDKWKSSDSMFDELAADNAKSAGRSIEKNSDGKIKKFIVAACRVKDGASYLERVLPRISSFCDEIVILNSKLTTDNTKEICAKFPKVVILQDDQDDMPGAREADSRNRLLDLAYSRHPDWIWLFDADEMPEERVAKKIDLLTNPRNPEIFLWTFPVVQLWNSESQRRMDGVWGGFRQGRMFRALPGLRIENSNNLIHCGSHPSFPRGNTGWSYVKIIHYGNVDSTTRKAKYDRYTKIDTDKDLNMVLGGYKDYYWQLYYGAPDPKEKSDFDASGRSWVVLPDPKEWSRPPYGAFFDRDVYRHVYDESGMSFVPFGEHPTISLTMLSHGEGNLIANCINSVSTIVDEIIVVDTGSQDTTKEIAEQLGAEVYEFPWENDFSKARNFSMEKATGDWILRLDPDEVVPRDTVSRIPTMVRDADAEGFIFPIMNWLENPQTPNAQWALSETCRLYKNMYPKIHFTGLVHEELDDSFVRLREERKAEAVRSGMTPEQIQAREPFLNIKRSPFAIHHYGYLRGREFLDKKFDYYCQLGNKQIEKDQNDYRPYFNTAVHYYHIGDYEKALKNYSRVLEMDPDHHMALNDVGVMYWIRGNLELAEQYFRKALSVMNDTVHEFHKTKVIKNLERVKVEALSRILFR